MRVALKSAAEPIVVGAIVFGTTLPWYSQIDAVDTQHLEPGAATTAFQSSDTNIAVSVANGVTSNRDFFDYIEIADIVSTDVIEVVASLNVTLTALGGDPTAVIAAAYGTTTPTAAAQGYSKLYTNAANQLITPVGTFTGLTGTYRFGVEANITHDSGGTTAAATAFNIELQVTVVRR